MNNNQTTAWSRLWSWLTTRQTCKECRLLRVEAKDIDCPCLTRWPDGLKGDIADAIYRRSQNERHPNVGQPS
jgi:hypothetical protein